MNLWTQYQALVFGFYYRLLKQQQGRPLRAPPNHFEVRVVHSRGHVVLRHAATGIYASIAEEVAIATDDIDLAVGRIRGQDVSGIVIA